MQAVGAVAYRQQGSLYNVFIPTAAQPVHITRLRL